MARIAGRDKKIAQWLEKIGVDPHMARRVIIDIPCDGAVTLYIEGWGDSRMFEIEPPPELTTDIVVVTPEEDTVVSNWVKHTAVEITHTDLTEKFKEKWERPGD